MGLWSRKSIAQLQSEAAAEGTEVTLRRALGALNLTMSWFECPHCGKPSSIFGAGGGERLAKELDLPLLGQIPLYPRVLEGGDTGAPIVSADPGSSAARALSDIATRVVAAIAT